MELDSLRTSVGLAAGILAFSACPIYVRSILKGDTRPDRSTWWILWLGSLILTASYSAAGARETIWIPVAYCVNYLVAAILSLFYGADKPSLSPLDRICLAGAVASAALWWLTQNPITALSMQMAMETFALMPTMEKTYRSPKSESSLAWSIATVASVLNVIAMREFSYAIAAYPLFVLVTNASIAGFAMRSRPEPASV